MRADGFVFIKTTGSFYIFNEKKTLTGDYCGLVRRETDFFHPKDERRSVEVG